MTNANRALADGLPDATYQTLPGQNHMVKAQAIAPVLTKFFAPHNYGHVRQKEAFRKGAARFHRFHGRSGVFHPIAGMERPSGLILSTREPVSLGER